MIKEAYCSKKVSELLKEKGFNEPIWTRYEDDNEVIFGDKYNWNNSPMGQISAPTHQMAMAWLREAHNVSIEPFVDYGSGDDYWWTVDITKIKKNGLITELSGYKSYEEAVEAALKYYLENLI